MSRQQYTPVPGMGNGLAYSEDSRYPTADRTSFPNNNANFPSPYPTPYTDNPADMPLMAQFPSAGGLASTNRPFTNPQALLPGSEQYYPMSDQLSRDTASGGGYGEDSLLSAVAQQKARSRKRSWIIAGVVLGVLALIGVVVGVVVSQVNKDNGSSDSSSSSGASGNGTLTVGNDPSNFTKNADLHQNFWGFAYTPNDAQVPWCGATQTNVTRDIQLLSQLTTRLRLYGANCNQTALVMQAIQDTKVNMTVWLGIYVDSNETAYTDQLSQVVDVLKTYGTDHVSGITVGNEYILNTAGTSSLTSSTYLAAVKDITDKITEVNSTIQALGLSKTLPIGTSDAGSILSKKLASGVDYFMANVHPYFGTVAIDDAAVWTYDFFNEFDVDVAATASNNPACYIAETGWPTQSLNASDATNGAGSPQGDASLANLQTFLDTFVCDSNKNGTQYFFFEAFDEPWKAQYGGVEPYWGLFDSDRNLKNLTIPTCS